MEYIIHILVFIIIYGIVAISLDIVLGWAGLLNVSQPAFLGIGAYSFAICTTRYHMSSIVAILIGIVISGIVSLGVGYTLRKLKSEYYTLASLGLMAIFTGLATNLDKLTRGPLGIGGVPKLTLGISSLTPQIQFFIIALIIIVVLLIAVQYILKAPFGRILAALRDDDEALQHFGYNTPRFKLFAFVFASVIASIGGALLASYLGYINPGLFSIAEGIFLFSIVIIGGLGSSQGAIMGTLILFMIPELLRFVGLPDEAAAYIRQILYGVFLVGAAIILPRGLLGRFKL